MGTIEKKVQESVALITMNSKDKNELNGPFTQELRQCLDDLKNDSNVKAVVITGGNEKYFCTGLDLQWMSQQKYEDLISFLVNMTQLLKDTALFPKPFIGAINGHAFGLGAIWASGFDFRLVRADRGFICFPEMDINIPFLPGMIALCEHGLGKTVFREMAYSAKRYGGIEAVQIGWAREALSADQLLPRAIELAKFMSAKAQPAFALTKQRWAKHIAQIIDEQDEPAIREQIPRA